MDLDFSEFFVYKDGRLYWKKPKGCRSSGSSAGTMDKKGYLVVTLNRRQYLVHRIIYAMHRGHLPKMIDHIDCNPLNNKIENLRAATNSQNKCNTLLSVSNKSGVKGVCWDKSINKWKAGIKTNGKQIHLGYFLDLNDAGKAYAEAATKIHGEFARF